MPGRSLMPRVRIALATLLGPILWLGVAHAETIVERDLGQAEQVLKDTKQAIAKEQATAAELEQRATRLQAEIDKLRSESVTVAAETRAMERMVEQLEARLGTLFAEELRDAAALEERAGPRAETLGAMARLSRTPPRALMLSPGSVVDSSRTILLLSALSSGLESEAAALNGRLAQLASVRNEITRERLSLEAANRGLAERRARLEGLISDRAALERETASDRSAAEARIATLVREARSLEELVERLAREPVLAERPEGGAKRAGSGDAEQEGPGTAQEVRRAALDEAAARAAADPREGAFAMPTDGRLVGHFGDAKAPGVTAKGISIETRADSPVVAPFAGKIVFAGPFHDYGRLLIIAHGQGYHTLLAGLGRIDSTVGRWVLEGEPVGVMGSTTDSRPQLYLELRHKGRPVNPLPWLATGSSKLSG